MIGCNPPLGNKAFSDEESENETEYFEFMLEKPIVTENTKFWQTRKRSPDGRFQSPDNPLV